MSGWQGSTRRARLPSNWRTIRKRILTRDPTCRICHQRQSVEVDHEIAGDDHSDDNLRGVCEWCHKRKSATEGSQARAAKGSRLRPKDLHPGLK